ncbi:hypothetical protein D3C71_1209540 [compost metagenome]
MIMPPIVIRICFKCCPYTGRTITRSNARPTAPATSMPTIMAGSTAARFIHRLPVWVQSDIAPSTVAAM